MSCAIFRHSTLIAATLVFLAPPALAQTSLAQAVLVASERDPGITAVRYQVSRRSIDIETVKEERYPQVSFGADTSTTDSDGAGLTLTVSQILFDWGDIRSRIAAASQERVIAVAELKIAIEELTLDVSNYFLDIEVIDQKIARTREYLAFSHRIADHARARATAGLGDRGEVARAELEVGRTEERMVQLTSDRSLALSQLEFLMGRFPGAIQSAPELDFIGRYGRQEAVTSAVRLSPEYVTAQAELGRAAAGIDTARAARLPKIRLQGQVRGALDGGKTRSSLGLNAGVDLGASGITGRQVQSARLEAEAARSNVDAIGRNLANSARSALERVSVLKASEASQARQLAQAAQVMETYEQQFVGGQRELLDLLTTGRDHYDAQMDRIDTYDERRRTEYQAAFDLGVLGTLILANSSRG